MTDLVFGRFLLKIGKNRLIGPYYEALELIPAKMSEMTLLAHFCSDCRPILPYFGKIGRVPQKGSSRPLRIESRVRSMPRADPDPENGQ